MSNPRLLVLAALAGSCGLLGGALAFQYLGGLAPCPMCIWQRWPHVLTIVLAGAIVLSKWYAASLAGTLICLIGAGLGAFHAGVEWRWWEGPTSCSAPLDVSAMSTDDLLAQIVAAPIVRCDEIVWQFLGLSMAGWNAVVSLILALLFWLAWRAYGSSSASQ